MRRAWISVVFAVALVAAACTSSGGGGGTETPSSGGPSIVVFWQPYSSGTEKSGLMALVNEFNKAHEGTISVEPLFYGNADYALQKVETAIAGGVYPDIAYLYGSWAANIAGSPQVLALNDFIDKNPSWNWDDFWEAERLAATVNGKIVGVPALVDNLAIVYNKALFDQAGLAYPSPDWTWSDFEAAAKALTDPANKVFGWTMPADGTEDTVWHYEAMLWEAGGDILNADNTQAVFNSPQGVEAMTVLQDLGDGGAHAIYVDTQNTGQAQQVFNSGKIGMMVTGPWDLANFTNVDYGVQIMPAFTGGDHETISGPDNWVLFNNGPARSQAAFEFISWLTAPEQDMRYALACGHLPLRESELTMPDFQQYLDKYVGIQTFVENEKNALKARPVTPKYPQVSEALGQAIVSVLLGEADAQTALDQAAQTATAALAAP
jgi:multiple sugar transport system substrate-binding protein